MQCLQRVFVVSLLLLPQYCSAQVSGNVSYGQTGGRAKAEQAERAKHLLSKEALPPSGTSTFIEANVLMNVVADAFVAVFGITEEGATLAECGQKMDARVKALTAAVERVGIASDDLFVDFIAQNKIYGYEVMGEVAREKLVGFELKKNVSLRYRDKALLDKLVAAAAGVQVFDLVKVDYVVKDLNRVQERLAEEAARIVKQKTARYEKLLGIKLQPPAQIYAEKFAAHYPTQMYDAYAAFESEEVTSAVQRQRHLVQSARKNKTFFYNGLDGNGFDDVINPIILEPVVQFTFLLKLKYEVEQVRANKYPEIAIVTASGST